MVLFIRARIPGGMELLATVDWLLSVGGVPLPFDLFVRGWPPGPEAKPQLCSDQKKIQQNISSWYFSLPWKSVHS
jgi:hypothetical protein